MRSVIVVCMKELVDHMRDLRSLTSTSVYVFMGPAVIYLLQSVSAEAMADANRNAAVISVFTLLSAFSGATAIAADMIAGERERRSLLPLLLSGATREQIVSGKWLAAGVFAAGSCVLTLLAFLGVTALSATMPTIPASVLWWIPNLLCLALLAAALQVLISSYCRSAKEANSCLTILIFAAMGLSMWAAFSQADDRLPWSVLPIAGDQRILQMALGGESLVLPEAAMVGLLSMALAIAAILAAGRLFRGDSIVYGT